MLARRSLLGALLMTPLWGGAISCHTVFDGELGNVACSQPGAFGPPACPEAHTCVDGACVAIGTPQGRGCDSDQDCRPGDFCFDPASVGEEDEPRCTRPCCAATDCGSAADGQVCWHPKNGVGALCWPAAAIGRQPPGESLAGEPCAVDSECRSGACAMGKCVDGCCDHSYCGAPGDVCRIKPTAIAEQEIWACGAPPMQLTNPFCDNDNDCGTGRCLTFTDTRVCAAPCCSSSTCGTLTIGLESFSLLCRPLPGSTLRTCSEPATLVLEPRGVGLPCDSDDQCRSGLCFGTDEDRYCSDWCCDDASCGDTNRFACRPIPDEDNWALRCVRK